MRYISDRGKVELSMPLVAIDRLVRRVVLNTDPVVREAQVQMCAAHMNAALDAIHGTRPWPAKMIRRVQSAYEDMMLPYRALDADPMIFGLALYWFVWLLAEEDYLRVGDDAYRRALESFFQHVEPAEADENFTHGLARAGAREILALAQARGLYQGVRPDRLLTPWSRT